MDGYFTDLPICLKTTLKIVYCLQLPPSSTQDVVTTENNE
jgi:hypothetical protein